MDAVIIMVAALVLCLLNGQESGVEEEPVLERETRLNPEFYVDENAFMEVANVLGFGVSGTDSDSADVLLRD